MEVFVVTLVAIGGLALLGGLACGIGFMVERLDELERHGARLDSQSGEIGRQERAIWKLEVEIAKLREAKAGPKAEGGR